MMKTHKPLIKSIMQVLTEVYTQEKAHRDNLDIPRSDWAERIYKVITYARRRYYQIPRWLWNEHFPMDKKLLAQRVFLSKEALEYYKKQWVSRAIIGRRMFSEYAGIVYDYGITTDAMAGYLKELERVFKDILDDTIEIEDDFY